MRVGSARATKALATACSIGLSRVPMFTLIGGGRVLSPSFQGACVAPTIASGAIAVPSSRGVACWSFRDVWHAQTTGGTTVCAKPGCPWLLFTGSGSEDAEP